MYPNPATDKLMISFDAGIKPVKIEVLSAAGKECGRWTVLSNVQALQLDVSTLPKGHYFVRIITDDAIAKAYPFVKQ